MSLPARQASRALGSSSVEIARVKDGQRPLTERLLAFGALTVTVVENTTVAGYQPGRFTVILSGRALQTEACGFDMATGRRWIETEIGTVVVPSAKDRTEGGCLTVNGMAIPGA